MDSGLSLADVLKGGSGLKVAVDGLLRRGWVLLRNDDDGLRRAVESLGCVERWFRLSREEKRKWREWNATMFPNASVLYGVGGYGIAEGKESFRMLTGSELEPKYIPAPFEKELCEVAGEMDRVLHVLMKRLCGPLLHTTPEALCCRYNVPFWPRGRTLEEQWETSAIVIESDRLHPVDLSSFAVLDVAFYENRFDQKKELNCAAHFDPGVFSLSILSTQPGLQLQDEHKRWHDVPLDMVALWTGDVARRCNPKCAVGVHRVVKPSGSHNEPRMAVWAEIATREQLLPSLRFTDRHPKQGPLLRWDETSGGERVIRIKNISPQGEERKDILMRVSSGNLVKALHAIEEYYGLPFVKIMFEPAADENGLITPWEPQWNLLTTEPPPNWK